MEIVRVKFLISSLVIYSKLIDANRWWLIFNLRSANSHLFLKLQIAIRICFLGEVDGIFFKVGLS
jgi:hypothetical protein